MKSAEISDNILNDSKQKSPTHWPTVAQLVRSSTNAVNKNLNFILYLFTIHGMVNIYSYYTVQAVQIRLAIE